MTYRLPTDLARYSDIRSDETERYHLRQDKQACTLNAFTVCMPPYINEPGLLVETFEDAIATLRYLRSQPFVPLYPADVFVPFGIIIATNIDVVSRDAAIRLSMLEGGVELTDEDRERIAADPCLHENGSAQMRRVAALYRTLALVRGMPLPTGTIENWKGLATLQ